MANDYKIGDRVWVQKNPRFSVCYGTTGPWASLAPGGGFAEIMALPTISNPTYRLLYENAEYGYANAEYFHHADDIKVGDLVIVQEGAKYGDEYRIGDVALTSESTASAGLHTVTHDYEDGDYIVGDEAVVNEKFLRLAHIPTTQESAVFKAGDKVTVAEGATYLSGVNGLPTKAEIPAGVYVVASIAADGDLLVKDRELDVWWDVSPQFATLYTEPEPEPKTLDEQAQDAGVSAAQLLRKAADLLEGDRNDEYGGVLNNHERIAAMWTTGLGKGEFTAGDVATAMGLVKVSRMLANPKHEDSYVDMLAYTAITASYGLITE